MNDNQPNTLAAFQPGGIMSGMFGSQSNQSSSPDTSTTETTNSTSSKPSLDPQIVTLAQSIRQNESGGNYELPGASGEYGAYQFTPDTWNGAASKYGVNVPLQEASPEQQNEVAYKQLADWKQEHPDWNIGNFASAWNAGDRAPNAYLENHVGTNQFGVPYNTPAYAQKVAETYQKLKANQPITNPDGSDQVDPTTLSQNSQGMPEWERLLIGIPLIGGTLAAGFATGGAADAAIPEEVAGLGAGSDILGNIASGAKTVGNGLLNVAKSKVAGLATVGGVVEAANKIFGGSAPDTSGAIADAGTQEANATQQATQSNTEEQETLADQQRAEQQIKDSENLGSALNQSLQNTPTGNLLSQTPQGQQGIQYMAQYGFMPNTSTGVNDLSAPLKQNAQNRSDLSEGIEKVLEQEGGQGSLESARQKAYANIQKYVPTHDQEAARGHVDEILGSADAEYGTGEKGARTMPLSKMEKIKRETGRAGGKWDATTPSAKKEAFKAINRGTRDEIANSTKHKKLYEEVMKEEEKSYLADKVMKKMHGKKAVEHKSFKRSLLKESGKYLGAWIGNKIGGPVGAVAGAMVGNSVSKAVDKRYGKTFFESKEGKKLIDLTSQKSPEAGKALRKELKKYGIKSEELKKELQKPERQLPSGEGKAPGIIYAGAKSEIEKPAQKINREKVAPQLQLPAGKPGAISANAIPLGPQTVASEPTKTLQAKKGLVGQNPKTGKFFRTYSSQGTPNEGLLKQKKTKKKKTVKIRK